MLNILYIAEDYAVVCMAAKVGNLTCCRPNFDNNFDFDHTGFNIGIAFS
jgi:hypothetical protein